MSTSQSLPDASNAGSEAVKGVCKFQCHSYFTLQFHAMRTVFLGTGTANASRLAYASQNNEMQIEDLVHEHFVRSLSMSEKWDAKGGKSGALFYKTSDERFVIKHITKTELQMFLDFAPAYFEYMSKAFFPQTPHGSMQDFGRVSGWLSRSTDWCPLLGADCGDGELVLSEEHFPCLRHEGIHERTVCSGQKREEAASSPRLELHGNDVWAAVPLEKKGKVVLFQGHFQRLLVPGPFGDCRLLDYRWL
jgi:hypothetical protein